MWPPAEGVFGASSPRVSEVVIWLCYLLFLLPVLYLIYTILFLHPSSRRKWKKVGELLSHPDETTALLRYFIRKKRQLPTNLTEEEQYCFFMLTRVSRSFASVIIELHDELRTAICVFYLTLRALDSIEDDMTIDLEVKLAELRQFSQNIQIRGWNSRKGYGAANVYEQELLENFDRVIAVYYRLSPQYQSVIKEIATQMAEGMAIYQTKEVATLKDYDSYCYYVAGLVGVGLTRLFYHSALMGDSMSNIDDLAISMGLFLQKTNIIRDYLEDTVQQPPRCFYPKEVWSKYVKHLGDLQYPQYHNEALSCLNDMVTDALRHVPDCLQYMSLVDEESCFRFCAIPQVMAVATLERCYNNHDVFTGVVKIRKGEAAKLILQSCSFESVVRIFEEYLHTIASKIPKKAHSGNQTRGRVADALQSVRLWKKQINTRRMQQGAKKGD